MSQTAPKTPPAPQHINQFPDIPEDEQLFISPEGLKKLMEKWDPKDPQQNFDWTTDYSIELPIKVQQSGEGSLPPETLIDVFKNVVAVVGNKPALSVKKNKKWVSISYAEYLRQCEVFAKALMALKVNQGKSVNIIGFNSPEWAISFYGSIFGNYLPVGIYTTNNSDACHYVADHSDCEVAVVENVAQLNQFLDIWKRLPQLKYVVMYNDQIPTNLPEEYQGRVLTWVQLMEIGTKFVESQTDSVAIRQSSVKPGSCCTLVYTSGTTGPPKGVMLSHDNYSWTAQCIMLKYEILAGKGEQERILSYLPLSHVAGQILDLIGSLVSGSHVYFADDKALQGTLVQFLTEVRPTIFLSVPRVWEKIYDKMMLMAAQSGFLKRQIATWAKSIGPKGTYAEYHNLDKPFGWSVAQSVVYNQIKTRLGLDQARFLVFGAAPLSPAIRHYFLSLNMYLRNGYGMSECAGPETGSEPEFYDDFDSEKSLRSTGRPLPGTDIKIYHPDKDGNGQICYKGRNRFMGYYKNEQATRDTIDKDSYLHSGDVGRLDLKANLEITGRIKELIITAGGENVAPVLIENEIKEELKFLGNCMVCGDQQKFLSVLLTLKYVADAQGKITDQLDPDALAMIQLLGIQGNTFEELEKDPKFQEIINAGIERANQKAISKAQNIAQWRLIKGDFSVDGGELTPTLQLKRSEVAQKHKAILEDIYQDAPTVSAAPQPQL